MKYFLILLLFVGYSSYIINSYGILKHEEVTGRLMKLIFHGHVLCFLYSIDVITFFYDYFITMLLSSYCLQFISFPSYMFF